MLSHQLTIALRLAAIVAQCMLAVHCSPSTPWGLNESDCAEVLGHLVARGFINSGTITPTISGWVHDFISPLIYKGRCSSDTIKISDLERVCKLSMYHYEFGRRIGVYIRNCGSATYWNRKIDEVKSLIHSSQEIESIFTHTFLEGLRSRHEDYLPTIDLKAEDLSEIFNQVASVSANEAIDQKLLNICSSFHSEYRRFMESALLALSYYDGSRHMRRNGVPQLNVSVKDDALRFQICKYIIDTSEMHAFGCG